MTMYLILSTSLNPKSRSRVLAQTLEANLKGHGVDVTFYDLQEVHLPLCDGGACYGDPEVQRLGQLVESARGIIIATPVYNYDVNAAAKNVIELTGKAWTEKVAGFLCAAGGGVSYMAVMSVANSLMLDFRTFILPKFVFATGRAFDDDNNLVDEEVIDRVNGLGDTLVRITSALA